MSILEGSMRMRISGDSGKSVEVWVSLCTPRRISASLAKVGASLGKSERVWVDMGDKQMKIWALPLRYVDILTVYSAQGSQFDKVHVHASRFKPKRNLLYTAVTRAKKLVKISGIGSKLELRKKMELHAKTVLWQHERCGQAFSAERLAAARRDAARMQ